MADGTTFIIDIDVRGASAAQAAQGVAALADRLTAAGSASAAAAEAVRAGESAYRQAEAAATSAAKAVERIGLAAAAQQGRLAKALDAGDAAAVTRATTALGALNTRQAEAQAKATSTAAAMTAQAAALDRLRGAATGAAAAEKKLSKEQESAKKRTSDVEKATKDAASAQQQQIGAAGELEGALGRLGGPLGAIGQRALGAGGALLKLGKTLGAAGPYVAAALAIVAIAAAIAVAAAAAVVGTAKIAIWATGLADAARTQGLLSAGIARTVAGGVQLDKKIADLTAKLPATREELLALAGPLADGGLRGRALTDALQTAAVAAAKLKFGPNFQQQMLSIPSQTARIQAGFSKIFSGLKVEKLLTALSRVTDLFEENSATANAAKVVFESIFQPIIDGVTAFIPKVVTAFIQFEILVLKAMIAIKPLGSKILMVAQVAGILALVVGAVLLYALVSISVVLIGLTVAVSAVIAVIGAIIAAFVYFAVVTYQAGAALIGGIGAAFEWLKGLSLSEIGGQLIDGLVSGLMSAGPKVLAAITGIAKGAIDAAKKALGIASPSRIFAEIGMDTAAGMTEGVDGGAADVQGSLESLVNPPDAGGAAGAAAASGGESKGSAGGMFAGATFTFSGVGGDAKAFAEQFREHLETLMSRAGGGSPSAA